MYNFVQLIFYLFLSASLVPFVCFFHFLRYKFYIGWSLCDSRGKVSFKNHETIYPSDIDWYFIWYFLLLVSKRFYKRLLSSNMSYCVFHNSYWNFTKKYVLCKEDTTVPFGYFSILNYPKNVPFKFSWGSIGLKIL